MKRNRLPNSDNREEKHSVVLTSHDYEEALIHLRAEKARRTTYLWTQRDGMLISVSLMSWDHLCRTISMLERKKKRLQFSEMLAGEVL